ncbi:MAG: CBS domain-containing protein [Myxococcota bacterium]
MAQDVEEIMNAEVFSVVPAVTVGHLRRHLAALEIAAAPVVDDDLRPVGFVTLRDISGVPATALVKDAMSEPPVTVEVGTTIEDVGKLLARRDIHHLCVVDGQGLLVGYVGSLDVIRGLLGLVISHPDTFPHYDSAADVAWSNECEFVPARAAQAPAGAGLLHVIHCRAGQPNRLVWSEGVPNVRARLEQMMASREQQPATMRDLPTEELRFRAASTDATQRFAAAAATIGLNGLRRGS